MERQRFLACWRLGPAERAQGAEPLYPLTYDHGGLVLWGIEHLAWQIRTVRLEPLK